MRPGEAPELETCPGCGARVPRRAGATHPYMLGAPGCWEVFGRLTAARIDGRVHPRARQYAVDAYAAQHPGTRDPRAVRSVAVHLISLLAVLELGADPVEAPRLLARAAARKGAYAWLEPPSVAGALTVADAAASLDLAAPTLAVRPWAESVWSSWSAHHDRVREWHAALFA